MGSGRSQLQLLSLLRLPSLSAQNDDNPREWCFSQMQTMVISCLVPVVSSVQRTYHVFPPSHVCNGKEARRSLSLFAQTFCLRLRFSNFQNIRGSPILGGNEGIGRGPGDLSTVGRYVCATLSQGQEGQQGRVVISCGPVESLSIRVSDGVRCCCFQIRVTKSRNKRGLTLLDTISVLPL